MILKILRKIIRYLLILISTIILVTFLILFTPAIWRNLITYPRFEKAVNEFNSKRKETGISSDLNTYRGIIHAHSYWSHDSEGTLHDLVPAAKHNGVDFIFLTDHPRNKLDTFPRGYRGYYDGVLIEPGSERQKFGIWPLDSAVIDWNTDKDTLLKQVVLKGGMTAYVHTEEPHNWSNPYYQGMEIYNIHTDTKDDKLLSHIPNFLVNGKKYRHWALRELFDEQTEILALWDSLNNHRKIFGFSAVDTHENQNIRARQLDDGRVQWLGPNAKPFDTVNVNILNRWMFSEPDVNGWVFKVMMDTYTTNFNYVMNYVFADTLSLNSVSSHVKQGHLYCAFKSLGDASGFIYNAQNNAGETSAILGDSVKITDVSSLYAISPLPGEFRLVRNGELIDTSDETYEYSYKKPIEKGNYRLEIHVKIGGKLLPWLYTNPIYIY